mgnify:CR=1 FL=1
MNTIAPTRSSAGLARWASLGGILYVVLFVIGVIVMFDGEPDADASPATVIAYYPDARPPRQDLDRLDHRRPRHLRLPLVPEQPAPRRPPLGRR